jgi:hypothetical protein
VVGRNAARVEPRSGVFHHQQGIRCETALWKSVADRGNGLSRSGR